jgi:cob(I)alamin adenosyltransferase
MVKLNRIYTKTGDDGTTGLVGGTRIRKDAARVEAYGEVDEANAAVGVAVVACRSAGLDGSPHLSTIATLLSSIQHDLFDAGADLATPVEPGESGRLRIIPAQTLRLEAAIDEHNDRLKPLTSFVLPGGSPAAAALHVARTVVRRAERRAVSLRALEPAATSPEVVMYLNRLSDLLFVLARVANHDGRDDVLWVPGANRR